MGIVKSFKNNFIFKGTCEASWEDFRGDKGGGGAPACFSTIQGNPSILTFLTFEALIRGKDLREKILLFPIEEKITLISFPQSIYPLSKGKSISE